ncbi:hypothetical protein MAPG_00331 [Magnaporthiopsis poae ATCC 64411]|uniref:Uncharacterized protein n=1 Tax=Magnaporthiopsis poae (strain ATCC 64411 / 73-15) TaxID=644358 RepID=A0A0C4DKQ3_MAGP6|nr:hypothetical protein MAPG_00331 [Magnaporthiopsis poae ATCC 64411]
MEQDLISTCRIRSPAPPQRQSEAREKQNQTDVTAGQCARQPTATWKLPGQPTKVAIWHHVPWPATRYPQRQQFAGGPRVPPNILLASRHLAANCSLCPSITIHPADGPPFSSAVLMFLVHPTRAKGEVWVWLVVKHRTCFLSINSSHLEL